jgi:pimeloyl-ACP methyl ester carboxylesterase
MFSLLWLLLCTGTPSLASHPLYAQQPLLSVLTPDGATISHIADGDTVKLRLQLSRPTAQAASIEFLLAGNATPIAACVIAAGDSHCETAELTTLGWYWDDGGTPLPTRLLQTSDQSAAMPITIAPRPVVFVHGFGATWEAWQFYLGENGYLARVGIRGYAVGDGQADGRMNTGNLLEPALPTNTIAENAAIVGQYIEQVKAETGASYVDLVAHSMGGLISRYYIARVMEERDVAQLIMLGSPQQGTACANLPASLNLHLPATLELRPDYVRDIFNQQITERHGVPFYILAGTPILSENQSPCTAVPSDIVISRGSAGGITATISEMPVLHTDLNTSEAVFTDFLLPLLQKPPGSTFTEPSGIESPEVQEDIQFTRVFTGVVEAGGRADITIQIDAVAVANFALYDPTQSLTVTVRGASGNVIELDPAVHGLVVVNAPETLVHLGYGFNNPRPGPWQITLESTGRTPAYGAPYALTALLNGGATLTARTSALLPEVGESVMLTARLQSADRALTVEQAVARIRHPDGRAETLSLQPSGDGYQVAWIPPIAGLYAVDIIATGTLPDGSALERSHFLAMEARDREARPNTLLWGMGGGAVVLLVLGVWVVRRFRRAPP